MIMFTMSVRLMMAKKGKLKMKLIEPRTPSEQTQTISAIFDVIKKHGPLTIADAWENLKGSCLRGLTNKRHMKIPLGWKRERQKLRIICNHDGPHKQFPLHHLVYKSEGNSASKDQKYQWIFQIKD